MPHYISLIHPLREGFFEQPTPAEAAAMQANVMMAELHPFRISLLGESSKKRG